MAIKCSSRQCLTRSITYKATASGDVKSLCSSSTFVSTNRLPNSIAAPMVTALSSPIPFTCIQSSIVALFNCNPLIERFCNNSFAKEIDDCPLQPVRNKIAKISAISNLSPPKAINFSRGL